MRAMVLAMFATVAGPVAAQEQGDLARDIEALSRDRPSNALITSLSLKDCILRIETFDPRNVDEVMQRTTLDLKQVVMARHKNQSQLGLITVSPSITNPAIKRTMMAFATRPGHVATRETRSLGSDEWTTSEDRVAMFTMLSVSEERPEQLMQKLTTYTETYCQTAPESDGGT